ncbi:WD40 repeat domain-containing protein, partial [Streptomyces sp. 4N509B]|uniref:WD40 repeat domain-containing protein n=1 Tax=Streptomyces sp. 4N509B TaxID=3457413 RepID=UPI003FCF9C75
MTTAPPLRPVEALYEQLLAAVPRDGSGRRLWHLAPPYLLRHAAQHAADAGRLDELLTDGEFLVHADPHVLPGVLRHHATSERARLSAAVYRASWGVHHSLTSDARRQLLSIDAARLSHPLLREHLRSDSHWQVRWATDQQVSTSLVDTLTGHTSSVWAVAIAELDGRPHAVTTSDDHTVRVWDLTTGTTTHTLTGHTNAVTAIAELDGRPHAVTTSDDHTVRVWDLTTGTTTHTYTGHTDRVRAVAIAELNGRPHALTTSDDHTVRVWDLTTGTTTHTLTGHTNVVWAVAIAELNGRPHALTTSSDHTVRVWDLTTGTTTHTYTGHTNVVWAVAITELNGRPHALTTSNDHTVRVWDLTTGTTTHTLTGHTNVVWAVAIAELNGRPHALTT